ncbi:MAG: hypothetical protein U0670_02365 [Anaerolineae bacterium]
MEILGIGGWELVALLILMLVVAGPKRMIQWSYVLGRELAKLRRMWGEASKMLQKEIDAAGIDYQVPTEPPTRAGLRNEAIKLLTPITKPMQQAMQDVENEFNAETKELKDTAAQFNNLKLSTQARTPAPKSTFKPVNGGSPMSPPAAPPANKSNGAAADAGSGFKLGSWSGGTPTNASADGAAPNSPGLGTWSAAKPAPDDAKPE